jgi:hypothetical protein
MAKKGDSQMAIDTHLGGVHEGMLASVNERKHGGDCSKLDMHLLPH